MQEAYRKSELDIINYQYSIRPKTATNEALSIKCSRLIRETLNIRRSPHAIYQKFLKLEKMKRETGNSKGSKGSKKERVVITKIEPLIFPEETSDNESASNKVDLLNELCKQLNKNELKEFLLYQFKQL